MYYIKSTPGKQKLPTLCRELLFTRTCYRLLIKNTNNGGKDGESPGT